MTCERTKQALASAKANGKQLGGLRDSGRDAEAAAVQRAKALAPLFEELADKSAREIARTRRCSRRAPCVNRDSW